MDFSLGFFISEEGHIIALISVLISLVSSLVRKATVDAAKLKESREKIKECQKMLKDAQKKGDGKALLKAQEELNKHMIEQMKQSFKPMIITLIPFILVFNYMMGSYSDLHPALNVTLTDKLPTGLDGREINISGGGVYSKENNTVTWVIGLVHTGTVGKVSWEINSRNNIDLSKKEPAFLYYFNKNGSLAPIVYSNSVQPASGVIMSLDENVKVSEDGSISSELVYRNTASNDVAYLPVVNIGLNWFWWYFLVSLIASIIVNKVIGVS